MIRLPASVEADRSRGLCMVCRVLKDSLISAISGQVGNCNCNRSELLCRELTGKQFPLLSGYTYSVPKWEEEGRLHKRQSRVRWVRSPLATQPQQLPMTEWEPVWTAAEARCQAVQQRCRALSAILTQTPHDSCKGGCLHKWQQTIRKNVSLLP